MKNGNSIQQRYYITDHLGSTRVVLNNAGSVVERYDYYPYGEKVPVTVANTGNTDYLYTGKESQNALFGINWYDSGARFQTTDGIFTGIDPLAEKYYHISPYAYCAGNPVRFADYDGADRKDKAIGIAIGVVTNVIPFSTGLRNLYTPTDPLDYNGALMNVDAAAMTFGEMLTKGGEMAMAAGAGAMAVGGTTVVASGGAAVGAGGAVVAVGAQALTIGAKTATAGVMLMGNASNNSSAGYEYGKEASSGNGDYSNLPDPKNAGPGKKTTSTQRKQILKQNKDRNGGVIRSDQDGSILDPPSKMVKGQKANMNQAEIDHITARSKGGSNRNTNLQVLSKEQNLRKGNR